MLGQEEEDHTPNSIPMILCRLATNAAYMTT